jgi:hypothetical protein
MKLCCISFNWRGPLERSFLLELWTNSDVVLKHSGIPRSNFTAKYLEWPQSSSQSRLRLLNMFPWKDSHWWNVEEFSCNRSDLVRVSIAIFVFFLQKPPWRKALCEGACFYIAGSSCVGQILNLHEKALVSQFPSTGNKILGIMSDQMGQTLDAIFLWGRNTSNFCFCDQPFLWGEKSLDISIECSTSVLRKTMQLLSSFPVMGVFSHAALEELYVNSMPQTFTASFHS